MNADYYQEMAGKTDGKHDAQYYALGLAGEAGEVANLLKKTEYHGHPYDPAKFLDELGDVMWYVARNASKHGYKLSEIMQFNLDKLAARYPKGFSSEASINRKK